MRGGELERALIIREGSTRSVGMLSHWFCFLLLVALSDAALDGVAVAFP